MKLSKTFKNNFKTHFVFIEDILNQLEEQYEEFVFVSVYQSTEGND